MAADRGVQGIKVPGWQGRHGSGAASDNVGLHAAWTLPPGQEELPQGQVVLRATNQVRGIELRPSEMQRLLLELMDLPLWAESVRRQLARDDLVPHPWPYFDDERKVWE